MKKLYIDQYSLDECIRNSHGIVKPEIELLTEVCTATLVETGEFADENDEEKKLFEYVDILHFLLRLNNILELDYMILNKFEEIYTVNRFEDNDTTEGKIISFMISVTKFINETRCFKYWSTKGPAPKQRLLDLFCIVMFNFMGLGNFMGYSAKQVLKAYEIKRQENFERQKVGY